MKLHVLSDLHLSRGGLEIPRNDADVVVLAGDIARPKEAVAWAASTFDKPVLYVAGNHEFYGGTVESTVGVLREHASGTCVRVLDNEELVIGGVRFLGATLWTDFNVEPGSREAAMQEARRLIYDFSRIGAGEGTFTPEQAAALFEGHAGWLASRLAEPHPGPTVVITHHAPSTGSIHPRFAGSLLNACFVSAAEDLVSRSRASVWIHGHTHDSFDYFVGGTRVVCNPRGYAKDGVNENPRFDAGFTVDVQ